MKMSWYNVRVCRAHRGAGKLEFITAYIFAESPLEVLKKYRSMPGVKRDFKGHTPVPDIIPLSPEETDLLEEKIAKERRISLNTAKRTWYYVSID